MAVFHATFFVVDHVIGRLSIDETPRPIAPRNCGQIMSAGTDGAAARLDVSSNAIAVATRIAAVYTRSPVRLWDPGTMIGGGDFRQPGRRSTAIRRINFIRARARGRAAAD